MIRFPLLIALIGASVSLTACEELPGDAHQHQFRRLDVLDGGLRGLPAEALSQEIPAWEPTEQSTPEWADPTDVELSRGRVIVADPIDHLVYLRNRDGRWRHIGGEGEGPEEFTSIRHVVATSESIWVLDAGVISRWDWNGLLQETIRPVPVMTSGMVIAGDSLESTIGFGDDRISGLQNRIRGSHEFLEQFGDGCRRLVDREFQGIVDCRRGVLAVFDGTDVQTVQLGHSGMEFSEEERDRLRDMIASRVAEVGYTDDARMRAVVEQQVRRVAFKDMWGIAASDPVTGDYILIYQEPGSLAPTGATMVVIDKDLVFYTSYRMPGAVVDVSAYGGELAALLRREHTGEVYLASGTYRPPLPPRPNARSESAASADRS